MSKELGNTLAKRLNVSPEEQLKGFLNSILQGRGQTAIGNRAGSALPLPDLSSAIVGQSINVGWRRRVFLICCLLGSVQVVFEDGAGLHYEFYALEFGDVL